MPITSVHTDPEERTVTLVADLPVPVERLWAAFSDPRQLERFWGPPTLPATFTSFDLRPGGVAHYRMTSSEGEQFLSLWQVVAVEEPRRMVFHDLFATEDGTVDESMPGSRTELTFAATASGSRVTLRTVFATAEDLEQLLEMGMQEGYSQAFGQLDAVVADSGGPAQPPS